MKIKEIVSDIKFWIGAIVLLFAILVYVGGYFTLPNKVERLDTEVVPEVKESVAKLADTVDDYIMEQRVVQREATKREELMVKLIEQGR